VNVSCFGDIVLPYLVLTEGASDRDVLCPDLVCRTQDHVSDEELSITQLAAFATLIFHRGPPDLTRLNISAVRTRLLQARLAVADSTELAM